MKDWQKKFAEEQKASYQVSGIDITKQDIQNPYLKPNTMTTDKEQELYQEWLEARKEFRVSDFLLLVGMISLVTLIVVGVYFLLTN